MEDYGAMAAEDDQAPAKFSIMQVKGAIAAGVAANISPEAKAAAGEIKAAAGAAAKIRAGARIDQAALRAENAKKQVEALKVRSRTGVMFGRAYVEGNLVAEAELKFTIQA